MNTIIAIVIEQAWILVENFILRLFCLYFLFLYLFIMISIIIGSSDANTIIIANISMLFLMNDMLPSVEPKKESPPPQAKAPTKFHFTNCLKL